MLLQVFRVRVKLLFIQVIDRAKKKIGLFIIAIFQKSRFRVG